MKMNPELIGQTIQLNVKIGYPGSRVTDLSIGGVKFQIDNDALVKAMELSGLCEAPAVVAEKNGSYRLIAVEKVEKDV